MSEAEQRRFRQSLTLRLKAHRVVRLPDRPYEFVCPVCGGTARAIKAGLNGHVHVSCETCCFCNR